MKISNRVNELKTELIKIRRDLHMIPELAFEEVETRSYIYSYLKVLNPDELYESCGIRAVFKSDNQKAKTLAFRADMDALPQNEDTDVSFRSIYEGKMHACGHDGHMAILLIFAKIVAERRKFLENNIMIVFQPAEETGSGAEVLIKDGYFENPKVDEIYGIHITPEFDIHTIVANKGAVMSGMDFFEIEFIGESVHGGMPHLGKDAIVAASAFVMGAQSIVSRNTDPLKHAVLTVGSFHAGKAVNVLAEKAVLGIGLRSFYSDIMSDLKSRIIDMAEGIAKAYGVGVKVNQNALLPPLENDHLLCENAIKMIDRNVLCTDGVMQASEDFSLYGKTARIMFFLLGTKDSLHNEKLHSSRYLLNEDILPDGVELYLRLAGISDESHR